RFKFNQMTITSSNPGGKRPSSGSVDANSREKRLKTIACDRCRRHQLFKDSKNNSKNDSKNDSKMIEKNDSRMIEKMIVKCDGDGYNHLPCKYCTSVGLECTYGKNAGRSNTNQSQIASNRANVSSQSNRSNNTQSNQNTRTTKKASSSTINTSFSIVTSSSNTITNSNRIIPQALPLPDNVDNVFEYAVKLFVSISPQNEDQVRQQFNHYISQVQDEKTLISRQLNVHDSQKSDDLTQRLVNLYFENFHPSLPVLHKAYFFEGFRDLNKSMPRILLYAVCAIGSNYLDDATIRKDYCDSYSLGLEYFELAQ
ncbi:7131_t:CDS:2, partial [Gigaspora rosea]